MPRGFYIYERNDLHARLKALGPKIRAQGGLPDAGEFPTLTETLLELVSLAERLVEGGYYVEIDTLVDGLFSVPTPP